MNNLLLIKGKPDAEKIKELQSILKKFLLRRTKVSCSHHHHYYNNHYTNTTIDIKDDIGIKLPQKTETIIDIELTFDQKQYYRYPRLLIILMLLL
jgi:SNF2 family DNA or RNA helicase